MMEQSILGCGSNSVLCNFYNIFGLTGVKSVENFSKKSLTFWGIRYNIIVILYLDRMRGDV